ncbi:MAG: alpha/beta hydrolase [Candidatus Izimaplasma sp.]|nr:alpha/beta hydrolase [Candidatus Izimaplasma bacterium]
MGNYYFHKHKLDDLVGLSLVKLGLKIKHFLSVSKRNDYFFEKLSKNYHYSKNINFKIETLNALKYETINYKDYEPKYCLLQLHGGAYIYGFNDNYRRMAKRYLKTNNNLKIYSPYYSLAPKYPFPKALEEVTMLYENLLKEYPAENIIIAGDSAGGGLALALGYEIFDRKLPMAKGIITMSAWTDFAAEGVSYEINKNRDIFFGIGKIKLNKTGYARNHSFKNEKISPKYGDYQKLPELLMFVGGHEIIESDTLDIGLNYEKARVHVFSKMFHVFPMGFDFMSSSRTAWEIIHSFINNQLLEEQKNE